MMLKKAIAAALAVSTIGWAVPANTYAEESTQETFIRNCIKYVINDDDTVTITGYDWAVDMDLVLPDNIDGKKVVRVEDYAFKYCTGLETLVVPNGIKSIGVGAFANCSWLCSVVLSESVEEIEYGAFSGCERLGSVTFLNPSCKIGKPDDNGDTISNTGYEPGRYFNVSITGYINSTAHAYAVCNFCEFIPLESVTTTTTTEEYPETTTTTLADIPASGDANGDGRFNIADTVTLQRWLLCIPGAELYDWRAADLCTDDILNIYDLCAMRTALV